jgi:aquaporin Z
MRKFLAEALGTGLLVFFGVGVATITFGFHFDGISPSAGVVATALTFGLVLLALAYALGPISGCHVNPAVTLGVLLAGRIRVSAAVSYWIAQFAGGILGALLLWGVLDRSPFYQKSTTGLGANGWGSASLIHISMGGAFLAEVILTGVFVFVILAVTGKLGNSVTAGLVIGLCLTLVHLIGIPVTGTSVNPARSLGPALILGGTALNQVWLFIVAPLVGGVVAAAVHYVLFAESGAAATAPGAGSETSDVPAAAALSGSVTTAVMPESALLVGVPLLAVAASAPGDDQLRAVRGRGPRVGQAQRAAVRLQHVLALRAASPVRPDLIRRVVAGVQDHPAAAAAVAFVVHAVAAVHDLAPAERPGLGVEDLARPDLHGRADLRVVARVGQAAQRVNRLAGVVRALRNVDHDRMGDRVNVARPQAALPAARHVRGQRAVGRVAARRRELRGERRRAGAGSGRRCRVAVAQAADGPRHGRGLRGLGRHRDADGQRPLQRLGQVTRARRPRGDLAVVAGGLRGSVAGHRQQARGEPAGGQRAGDRQQHGTTKPRYHPQPL